RCTELRGRGWLGVMGVSSCGCLVGWWWAWGWRACWLGAVPSYTTVWHGVGELPGDSHPDATGRGRVGLAEPSAGVADSAGQPAHPGCLPHRARHRAAPQRPTVLPAL